MSANRPYRPSLGIDVALKEIVRGRGTIYDEKVVDACLIIFQKDGYTFPPNVYISIGTVHRT
jgi:HD-GYP domain-containing protein (c-di-GMP phosphodiesterase class II)